jgi:hypothetical protein
MQAKKWFNSILSWTIPNAVYSKYKLQIKSTFIQTPNKLSRFSFIWFHLFVVCFVNVVNMFIVKQNKNDNETSIDESFKRYLRSIDAYSIEFYKHNIKIFWPVTYEWNILCFILFIKTISFHSLINFSFNYLSYWSMNSVLWFI